MTKIEEVARAIAASCEGDGSKWGAWTHEARAAIEAMREPTPGMLDKGPGEPYMDAYVWGRMIDAALKETP